MREEKDYLPVYREPASYARKNGELSPYGFHSAKTLLVNKPLKNPFGSTLTGCTLIRKL